MAERSCSIKSWDSHAALHKHHEDDQLVKLEHVEKLEPFRATFAVFELYIALLEAV